ncbi:MAG: hypothetical protein FWG34_01375 [Oscillospiraceae bacterium]|nr:hypothetical protein [Oscillospiraceae bacterium]
MKKTVLIIFVCFVLLMAEGCHINILPQTDDPEVQPEAKTKANQNETKESNTAEAETEDSTSGEMEVEQGELPGPDNNADVGDSLSWKQIYLELLLETQGYIENFDWESSDDYDSRYPRYISDIRLADLNFDGIPELFICGESVLASSLVSIYAAAKNGPRKIFEGLLHYGNGPTLYRAAPGDDGLAYRFTCLDASSDDYIFTVYKTDEKTSLSGNLSDAAEKIAVYSENYDNGAAYTFNGRNVTGEEYDDLIYGLFEGCIVVPGYPVSVIDIYPDEYIDHGYIYSEDEILRFLDLYSPEHAEDDNPAYIGDPYEMIVSCYRDYINTESDMDEAIEKFLADMKIELGMGGGQPMNELEYSLFELFGTAAGYAIRDINGDGKPELLVISEEDYAVSAIYALRGGGPVLVGAYWSRHRCGIDKNGTIYINGSSGAENSFSASYSLNTWQDGELLILIEMIGIEDFDEEKMEFLPNPRYYRIKDGEKTIISEDEAAAAWSKFPDNPTKNAGLPYRIF